MAAARRLAALMTAPALALCAALAACGGGSGGDSAPAPGLGTPPAPGLTPDPTPVPPVAFADTGPAAGNPDGHCSVPADAQAADTSSPAHVVGTGTPDSCSSQAVVDAVAQGGVITFNCGSDPVQITMAATAKVFNNRPDVVLDGGGKVTLSGGGKLRILYQNTCDDKQGITSAHCEDQPTPRLTLQNITLADGDSTGQTYGLSDVQGGGAVFVRGGRLKVVNSRFFRNRCEATGPDLGGAGIRALLTSTAAPNFVVNSTFGGADGLGNVCSNGGGLSGLFASYTVINSDISFNSAIGVGANPARSGTPGGGSGGGIYQDGDTYDLTLCGTHVHDNTAKEGGGALFFVSNDRTGTLSLSDSLLERNPNQGFETDGMPGVFVLAAPGQPVIRNTTIRK